MELTPKRRNLIRARWNGKYLNELKAWAAYFDEVRKSDRLMGRERPGKKNWKCNLSWLCDSDELVLQVIEGVYP